jgi:hypothetical protein
MMNIITLILLYVVMMDGIMLDGVMLDGVLPFCSGWRRKSFLKSYLKDLKLFFFLNLINFFLHNYVFGWLFLKVRFTRSIFKSEFEF